MWSLALYDLGLSRADFLRLTPRIFNALLDRARLAEQRWDMRFGIAAAIAYNSVPRESKRTLAPEDFYPSLKQMQEQLSPQQTAQQLHQACLALVAHFGGKIVRLPRRKDEN